MCLQIELHVTIAWVVRVLLGNVAERRFPEIQITVLQQVDVLGLSPWDELVGPVAVSKPQPASYQQQFNMSIPIHILASITRGMSEALPEDGDIKWPLAITADVRLPELGEVVVTF